MKDAGLQYGGAERPEVGRGGILDAAAALFRRRGYSVVSLRAIAQAAGIKAGSIYYHFGSKAEIVAAILDAGIVAVHEEVSAAVEALPATVSAREILHTAIHAHLRALLAHGDYTSANVRIFGQVPPDVRDANLPARRAYEKYWDSLLSGLKERNALRPDVDVARFRLLLIGALNATLEWFNPRKGSIKALADDYADILLNGILPPDLPAAGDAT